MLDLKWIRAHPDALKEGMRRRGAEVPVDELIEVDRAWREKLTALERLKAERNEASEAIGLAKRQGKDASEAIERMREVAARIKAMEQEVEGLEARLKELLLQVPNIPHASVPDGRSDADNVEVRRAGEPRQFGFEPKPHWELGVSLDIIDFERAAKVTGARFAFLKGLGARLERALIQFMLDLHTREHGYTELWPPFMANDASMTGTGQLPKFAADMFRVEGTDYYLIPTAEVPVTNYRMGEIIDGAELPLYYTAYSPCFRAEAGAHGRDTRGLIRQHQFDKVELVKLVKPETSYDELESLVRDAEDVLQRLGLPYRVVALCTGDLTFSSAKTYDLEVWMPSYGRYVEISSCSNFEDFQARRAEIRFRREPGAKAEYVHTLNGSGLAVGRTLAAILENYQEEDGSVRIPDVLVPYMGGVERIAPAG
ncbi:MAG: serine--tRNA ligase [Clostridia bacterium]|nr:serine--tRNA ligase [Bacillota bacterium]MBO2521248.1 serine--tRNA ligase [Bacillota bacterium]